MDTMKKFKCMAGFLHFEGEECGHIATQTKIPPPAGFQLPEDYYSPEAMAERKRENKLKYRPGQQRRNRFVGIVSVIE